MRLSWQAAHILRLQSAAEVPELADLLRTVYVNQAVTARVPAQAGCSS